MVALFDHEEIGSNSTQGAGSPVMLDALSQITSSFNSYKKVLWLDGTFFLRLRAQSLLNYYQAKHVSTRTSQQGGRRITKPGSFEQQLEAARRASDVKRMIFDGAPATLVSLIGHKQYRRCGRDIYYFLKVKEMERMHSESRICDKAIRACPHWGICIINCTAAPIFTGLVAPLFHFSQVRGNGPRVASAETTSVAVPGAAEDS